MNDKENLDERTLNAIAYHFATWMESKLLHECESAYNNGYVAGQQSKPKVSEDVETEALRSAGVLLSEHFEDEDDDAIRTTALRCWKGGVIHGASWQKEQMMKEAVEGEIINAGYPTKIELNTFYSKFEHGQEVKLIIIKEDTK